MIGCLKKKAYITVDSNPLLKYDQVKTKFVVKDYQRRVPTYGVRDLTCGVHDLTYGVRDLTCGVHDLTYGVRDLTCGVQT